MLFQRWLSLGVDQTREMNCTADGRVTGKRDLSFRKENADFRCVRSIVGWHDEYRLGEIEFLRQRLHLVCRKEFCIQHDLERVT